GTTAILHLQNGFILPPLPAGAAAPGGFPLRFHRGFPRVLGPTLLSVNVFFAIYAFTDGDGATLVGPGRHPRATPPPADDLRARAVPVCCPAGSMVVFDSTLWHAAGPNHSGRDRLAINHQFTRSWIKQQIDYVRALGDATVLAQPPRAQQFLGWY